MSLAERIIACERCPRLREHCREVAATRRRAYQDENYWGLPIPAFGPATARLLVLGLAPGNHGANRTGRVFTGDSSGDWLYRALFDHGFANQPESVSRHDGLSLRDAAVTCVVKCAPPQNKPTAEEVRNCRPWFEEELRRFRRVRVVVALGRIAFDGYVRTRGLPDRPKFAHGARFDPPKGPALIASYHPSRQNTNTGRLTRPMFDAVFACARKILAEP